MSKAEWNAGRGARPAARRGLRARAGLLPATLLFAGLALPAGPGAAGSDWQVDYAQSRLGFAGTQGGAPFEGTFARYTAEISFDAEQLAGSRAAVVIEMASATTGNAPRDATIREPDWFDVTRFPQARFAATGFRRTGPDLYEADGTLTLRDVTRPVVLPFRLTAQNGAVRAEGSLQINRTDYGVGRGAWAKDDVVGFPVTIRLSLLASPAR